MTTDVSLARIPGDLNGEWFYNGISFQQDNVVTVDGIQFAAYWAPDKTPRLARRLLPDGAWSTRNLSNASGYSFSNAAADLHNAAGMGVDADGFVHLCTNMHNDHLRYARSGIPYDHQSMFMVPAMVGTEEDSVTYPQFVRMPDGELLFFYRNGSSGNGNVYLNAYDTATRTWSRRHFLLDGLATGQSPYINRVAVDHDGRLHVFVIWRDDTGAGTNTDLSYLTSDDNGVTWTKADGTPYSIPISHPTIEVVVPSADNSGLLNQCGTDGDRAGHPHTAVQYNDGAGVTQVHHVWWDGTTWHNQQVTSMVSGETTNRPSVICPDDGTTYILYNGKHNNVQALYVQEVTGGTIGDPVIISELFPRGYEVTYDVLGWRERGELYLLAPNANSNGSAAANWNHVDNWSQQAGVVQGFDIDELADYKAGLVEIPQMVTTGSATGATASVGVSGDGLFARVTATGSSGTVQLRESRAGQTDVVLTMFTLSGGTQKHTPFIPLRLTGDGTVSLEGTVPDNALLEIGQINGVAAPPPPVGIAGFVTYTVEGQTFVVDLADLTT